MTAAARTLTRYPQLRAGAVLTPADRAAKDTRSALKDSFHALA